MVSGTLTQTAESESDSVSMEELRKQVMSRFKCQQTGNCCRAEGYVYVSESEIEKMARTLKLKVDKFKERFVQRENGWYVVASPTFRKDCFLDHDGQCRVYNARPKPCRSYPDWPEIWQDQSTFQKELLVCKGLKKAYAQYMSD